MLCVVVPCYNEEDVLAQFYVELKDVLLSLDDLDYRIIFVDDGSEDDTLEILNALASADERIGVYSLSRNFGHQIALSAGLDAARGDAVVMMDADLQHPPALIRKLIEEWRQGYDVVSAVREWTDEASFFKRLSSRAFYWLINHLGDTHVVTGAADFCLLSRRAHAALRGMPEKHRFLRGMVSWIGFRRALVPYRAPPRAAGLSKYTLWKMLSMAWDAVCSFSSAPMRLATRIGAAVVLLAGAYLVYVLTRYMTVGDLVPGWGSVISTVLIIGGMQLVFIGLIGGYLARVFEEVKRRPLYILKQAPHATDERTPPTPELTAATPSLDGLARSSYTFSDKP